MSSCSSIGYRAVTFAPCFPEEENLDEPEEINEIQKVLTYKPRAESLYTKQGDLLYQGSTINNMIRPDPDNIKLRFKFMEF
jgi:hypothetical protein